MIRFIDTGIDDVTKTSGQRKLEQMASQLETYALIKKTSSLFIQKRLGIKKKQIKYTLISLKRVESLATWVVTLLMIRSNPWTND